MYVKDVNIKHYNKLKYIYVTQKNKFKFIFIALLLIHLNRVDMVTYEEYNGFKLISNFCNMFKYFMPYYSFNFRFKFPSFVSNKQNSNVYSIILNYPTFTVFNFQNINHNHSQYKQYTELVTFSVFHVFESNIHKDLLIIENKGIKYKTINKTDVRSKYGISGITNTIDAQLNNYLVNENISKEVVKVSGLSQQKLKINLNEFLDEKIEYTLCLHYELVKIKEVNVKTVCVTCGLCITSAVMVLYKFNR